jgi:hypothetical protein
MAEVLNLCAKVIDEHKFNVDCFMQHSWTAMSFDFCPGNFTDNTAELSPLPFSLARDNFSNQI